MVALVAAGLTSAPRRPYTPHEKAFFADDATVEFVRPGLTITVNSAAVAANGAITVTYTLTDPNGLPLDSAGVTTPGTISLSYVAAVIPNGQQDYTTYTTRTATGTVLASTQQPGADSGGTVTQVGPGQYQYTFHTAAPSGFDATATHTIGIYGSRNLTPYGLTTNYASATYNFVPNGAAVTHVHDIIRHGQLQRLPRPVIGARRVAARHEYVRAVPYAAEQRPEYRRNHGRQGLLP